MAPLDPATGEPAKVALPAEESVAPVLGKQALLAAAFRSQGAVAPVLTRLKPAGDYDALIRSAAKALFTGSPGAAAWLLREVPIETLRDFAKSAATARFELAVASAHQPVGGKAAPQPAAGSSADGSLERDLATIDTLARASQADPIGFLHLERLQFTPVAYRRGDLMYAVTVLPGETLRMTHREWSRTEKEFTSLVSESTENEEDQTNSEKSELMESTSAQQAHSMAFSVSAGASGTYGVASFQANAGLQVGDQTANTQTTSAKSTRELTRKAASRTKQEHKVSFRVSTTTETEDVNYRELTNPTNDVQRWNFHRMMRDWQVDLYRYGVRLTYDVTIPEPGSYLLAEYTLLQQLDAAIAAPVVLPDPGVLTPQSVAHVQAQYQTLLDPPPQAIGLSASTTTVSTGDNDNQVAAQIMLTIPDGYELDPASIHVDAAVEAWRGWAGPDPHPTERTSYTNMLERDNRARIAAAGLIAGSFPWHLEVYWTDYPRSGATAMASVGYEVRPSQKTIAAWRKQAYGALVETLTARHAAEVDRLMAQRNALIERMGDLDPLQLRRLEREEVAKGVLRWVLGPSFQFYPDSLPHSGSQTGELTDPGVDETARGLYTTDGGILDATTWQRTLLYEQVVSFIHEAVEWENVNYVLYPYFWSEQDRWQLKESIRHADDDHLQFLRAGAARVVVTIRPGFESAWLHLVTTGNVSGDAPNLPIAAQLKAAAETYSPHTDGVQPLDEPGLLIGSWHEWTPTPALYVERGADLG